jgi:ankyrin repeat protein
VAAPERRPPSPLAEWSRMLRLDAGEPLAAAVTAAIQSGNVDELEHLLAEHPELATARIVRRGRCGEQARSLLHIATDYPGHFPNAKDTVRVLVAAGADVNARFAGAHGETALHWAASSDDVEVLDALLDAGADLEAPGSVIDGGTPLADAVAFGQWNAARRLVERGATPSLWQAAALGQTRRVEELVAAPARPAAEEITNAFWCACHGGQRETAEYLLDQGADINWIGHDNLTPIEAAAGSGAHDLADWLEARGGKPAAQLR